MEHGVCRKKRRNIATVVNKSRFSLLNVQYPSRSHLVLTCCLDSRGSSDAWAWAMQDSTRVKSGVQVACGERKQLLAAVCDLASMSSKSCNDNSTQKPHSPVSLHPLTRPRFGKFNSISFPPVGFCYLRFHRSCSILSNRRTSVSLRLCSCSTLRAAAGVGSLACYVRGPSDGCWGRIPNSFPGPPTNIRKHE